MTLEAMPSNREENGLKLLAERGDDGRGVPGTEGRRERAADPDEAEKENAADARNPTARIGTEVRRRREGRTKVSRWIRNIVDNTERIRLTVQLLES
mmetsp:Transcript_38080/g.74611  ORF Transcript_38080/g.74611 Transcript_38080/m.74611 type:complete len:97 (-) Transcript_38080:3-293(-)